MTEDAHGVDLDKELMLRRLKSAVRDNEGLYSLLNPDHRLDEDDELISPKKLPDGMTFKDIGVYNVSMEGDKKKGYSEDDWDGHQMIHVFMINDFCFGAIFKYSSYDGEEYSLDDIILVDLEAHTVNFTINYSFKQ